MSTSPRRALLVIDAQNEYVSGNLLIEYPPVQQSMANIGRAMDAARDAGMPIVVVQQTAPAGAPFFVKGTPGWDLHEVVAQRRWDHQFEKALPSCFAGTNLSAWLSDRQVDTLVVVGYMTQNCVDSTIRQAAHSGLAVEFLHDAAGAVPYANRMGSASAEEIHRVHCVVLQSRFAAVMSTDEWIAMQKSGGKPERDSIYQSNQRAKKRPG